MTPEIAIANIDDVLSSTVNYDESLEYELTSYDIDWLEEARDALEKQMPKKTIKKNPICYEKTKDGTEHVAYDYFCPYCKKQIKATEHHCECGQALDWGEIK